jgi:hypothetical protein
MVVRTGDRKREHPMTVAIDKKTRLVSQLISSCYQAQDGYRSAASTVRDETLRKLFQIYAQQRTRFAEELREHLPYEIDSGGRATQSQGSAAQNGTTEGDPIRECLEIDSKTVAMYKEALSQRALPTRAHFLISSQLALLERVQARMNLMLTNPPGAKMARPTRLQQIVA